MPYAMSVIVSRAIPEIDGLKPSHRKLLYTMYKMGLLTGEKTKSANVVGQTMKLNPHGDMAIYETLVRLTRGNGALLLPYVDSKGNFGKHYSRDMKYAAPRYTEVKLDKICEELFKDIDKDTVDFVDNYDGTMKEPKLLPATFPTILVNANHGIAVGMASSICSFNLVEVCNAAVEFIKDENTDLVGILKAPDFPTGGQLIYNEREMREIYEKGRGTFKLRAKYRYDKANSCIEIYEIPYTTTVEAIIDSIADLVKSNKIRDISDVRDETDLNGLKIALDIKRNADPDTLMNKLYKLTPLEDSFSCNFNILINGRPMVMGVRGILKEWVNFRMDCIKRQTLYDIDKKTQKLHILLGLEKILLDIDKAIKIIRNTEEEAMVVPNLMKGFGIDQAQAEFVAEIKGIPYCSQDLKKLSSHSYAKAPLIQNKPLLVFPCLSHTTSKPTLTKHSDNCWHSSLAVRFFRQLLSQTQKQFLSHVLRHLLKSQATCPAKPSLFQNFSNPKKAFCDVQAPPIYDMGSRLLYSSHLT